MKEQIKNIIESYCEGINHLEFNIADLDKMADEILALQLQQTGVSGSFNLKIEDCWTACTRIKADKGHLLNKSTEWNNAYQEGFEDCFKWLQNYR